ncbi:benzoate/H(+) symporter BenE family transporter [Variovorax sp. J22P240]|uniref:benzoate/H(+) symporter BenE family transporter n=1 Tax=Variovorax sp. J22P240 TaxID=3053514 RepID=UPI0025788CA2|nr:benzoate/H(+) symporter BenE family transporter [Variovorax sp. J22P240]MDM0002299.1 benzoate/H(+) symporter BenE family transporter [Variovorax sp. J22P240]
MLHHLEPPPRPLLGWRRVVADFGPTYAANGFIGFVFAATAPVAIVLSVGTGGGLSEAELASWLFGVFFVNGLISVGMCWLYRQPLAFFWTIPGTVLVGPALMHLSFAEVIGAYYATGALILVLGCTGWVRRAMAAIPMPIVMGMVAAVFLRFGLDLVRSLHDDVAIAGPMVIAWLALTAVPALGRRLPPLIGALLVGAAMTAFLTRMDVAALGSIELVRPVVRMPVWSWSAMVELVVPLTITVLVVQNGQGIAVSKAAGHEPPVNAVTLACGIGAMMSAAVGAVSTCLTGPTNAIISGSGERSRQYSAGIFTGILAMVFGLMSPAFTRLMLHLPKAFVMVLAGLAMLRVLQSAFMTAFKERFTLGALVAFLVTAADLAIFNIGAAFWGLAMGFGVSWCLERRDFSPQSASFAPAERLRAMAASLHRLVVASGALIDDATPPVKHRSEQARDGE